MHTDLLCSHRQRGLAGTPAYMAPEVRCMTDKSLTHPRAVDINR